MAYLQNKSPKSNGILEEMLARQSNKRASSVRNTPANILTQVDVAPNVALWFVWKIEGDRWAATWNIWTAGMITYDAVVSKGPCFQSYQEPPTTSSLRWFRSKLLSTMAHSIDWRKNNGILPITVCVRLSTNSTLLVSNLVSWLTLTRVSMGYQDWYLGIREGNH